MFDTNIEVIKNTFLEYKGTGMYIALFFVSMLYIFLKEKDKKVKTFFVYFPIIILLIVLNPIFNKIVSHIFTESIYWRLYWMIPLSIEIAYAGVLLIKEQRDKTKQIIATIGIIAIIIISGKYTYAETNFFKTGNLYKLTDESVRVAQLIGADGNGRKKAIVPETIIAHIRQIDSSIELAYKRDPLGIYEGNPIRQELNAGNVKGLTELAQNVNCNYIVFSKATVLTEPMENYGYEKLGETQNYAIYKLVDQ